MFVRRVTDSVVALPPWLKFIYMVSMTWAIGHCAVTAYGTPSQRFVAAIAGIIGALCILLTLHIGIAYHASQIAKKNAELATLRRVLADATTLEDDRGILVRARVTRDRLTVE